MPLISVILPAFNEEQTIADTIKDFHLALPDAEIWVINNHSVDETESIARETISSIGCKGGIINEHRPGKGNAVRRAFLNIEADVYILADADLTYPADHAHKLISPILNGDADMAVGDRHANGHYAMENKRAFHNFGNRLVRSLVNGLFNAKLYDIMSGYRALNRDFVKSYPILVEGFEIETDMTLHALDRRFRIIEIPIPYKDRPAGSFSKLNTFRDGARVINTITKILRYYRPLAFFLIAAIIFMATGFTAAIPVFEDWLREGYIHHVPLAILATGLEISAILLAAVGLILDSTTHQDKCNFERELLKNSSSYTWKK
ncbi:glycosyltransferase family 2 protein [Desulfobacter postgatei]|uniref:glycosyltransferase family 2 protein n=1 Tax=Desulfobacter postgatei TaxID=2293 RepID=UPI002A36DD59|nr:glycosyltransferase family 2 protein [Desulfobacter postgatei]MDX9963576.1 glycosyltransferase family 2 protein [Desulfobacter postgatei]